MTQYVRSLSLCRNIPSILFGANAPPIFLFEGIICAHTKFRTEKGFQTNVDVKFFHVTELPEFVWWMQYSYTEKGSAKIFIGTSKNYLCAEKFSMAVFPDRSMMSDA